MTVRLVGIVNTFFKAWYFLFFNLEVIDWDKKKWFEIVTSTAVQPFIENEENVVVGFVG